MKKLLYSMSILLVLALSLLPNTSNVLAEDNRIDVDALEVPFCNEVYICDPGVMTFPGNNIHIRGMVQYYMVTGASDDRMTGINRLTANMNWDSNMTGPGWGTFHNQSTIYNGYWEGTYSAIMYEGGHYISRIQGKGYGAFDGLIITAVENDGHFVGTIIEAP
ncbi:MAG: hypothetical protein K0B14_07015 [Anaerolineaceae bacterium]|nr:hypothetical protein [Anaerolineaceae bacterium]